MNWEMFVKAAEEAYVSLDIKRVMDLFDNEVIAYWNGRQTARNKQELTEWHHGFFAGVRQLGLTKTLRTAADNVLTIEWRHQRTAPDGTAFEGFAGELVWVNEAGRITKWHAHCNEYPLDNQLSS